MILPDFVLDRLRRLGVSPTEVEERFVRGRGPGGQKINKTSSTVWLRHGPTGVEVRCQAERSQAENRGRAWAELCRKLEARSQAAIESQRQRAERELRRTRQKSWSQKTRMVQDKRIRARHKASRGRVGDES